MTLLADHRDVLIIAPTRLWTHREFAFTLGESTYVRYNSFNNSEEFKKEILRANPTRFEIGPVYNARVSIQGFNEAP